MGIQKTLEPTLSELSEESLNKPLFVYEERESDNVILDDIFQDFDSITVVDGANNFINIINPLVA